MVQDQIPVELLYVQQKCPYLISISLYTKSFTVVLYVYSMLT